MATIESINQDITQQTALVNKLKADKADEAVIKEEWQKLGELKKSLHLLKGAAGSSKDSAKKKERLLLKTAKVLTSNSVYLLARLTAAPGDKGLWPS